MWKTSENLKLLEQYEKEKLKAGTWQWLKVVVLKQLEKKMKRFKK